MLAVSTPQKLLDLLAQQYGLVATGAQDWDCLERRTQPRFELESSAVEVVFNTTTEARVNGLLADISAAGARIVANRLPRRGERVTLEFAVGSEPFVLCAEVYSVGHDGTLGLFGAVFTDDQTPST